jgi:hypothetical protein
MIAVASNRKDDGSRFHTRLRNKGDAMTTKLIAGLFFMLSGLGAARAEAVYVGSSAAAMPVQYSVAVQPSTPMPSRLPPPPPARLPAIRMHAGYVQPAPAVVVTSASVGGQWIYTGQYGWVYMPYGDEYLYTTMAAGAYPYAYVYYPSHGWRWLTAPWVLGGGPHPYFGPRGALAFGWYRNLHRPAPHVAVRFPAAPAYRAAPAHRAPIALRGPSPRPVGSVVRVGAVAAPRNVGVARGGAPAGRGGHR